MTIDWNKLDSLLKEKQIQTDALLEECEAHPEKYSIWIKKIATNLEAVQYWSLDGKKLILATARKLQKKEFSGRVINR